MIARTPTSLAIAICAVLCAPLYGQTTWYVDDDGSAENGCTSWEDACPDLQTALGLAVSGDQIWVTQGTYRPAGPVGDRVATFQLLNGVGLYGGFAGFEMSLAERAGLFELTILSGDVDGDDLPVACEQDSPDCDAFGGRCIDGTCIISDNNSENSYHVVTGSGTDPTSILDGFTITAGNADGGGADNIGGGMKNDGGNLMLFNCMFSGNSAIGGGGMGNTGSSSPAVTHCTFSGNVAATFGGGMYNRSSSPVVTDCAFSGNTAGSRGGGMYNDDGSPMLTSCTFSENSSGDDGGGMCNISGSSPTLTSCTFDGNSAVDDGGGMYSLGSSPTMTNCAFSGNSAVFGGGMANSSSSPTVISCTFNGNAALDVGGGMANAFSNSTVTNCNFIGNSADRGGGMSNSSSSPSMLTNCTFSGNSATDHGGAMWNFGTNTTATNCTFSGNTAENNGGGIANNDSGTCVIANSIFWGNTDAGGANMDESAQISSEGKSNATVHFSDVQGLTGALGGTGNIGDDPLFVDADGADGMPGTLDDDLRLLPGSPAIDDADNSAVPMDSLDLDDDGDTAEPIPIDLDGEPRFIDDPDTTDCPQTKADCGVAPIADMGAYEFGADCNDNGIPDDVDIANETSDDCNSNGVPDECELPESCPNGICTAGCDSDCNANCVIDACDMDPVDPDGDGLVSDDCNGNGVPDECDLDPLDPDGDGEVSIDCNGNDIADECEIAACPPDTPFCDDCNLNGVLDGCDIDPLDPDGDGEISEDDDPADGVPDECVQVIEGDVNWTDDIWDLNAQYPDNDEANPDGVPDLHVTLAGEGTVVFLDDTIATDTLRIQAGATLQVTQTTVGDLTLEDPGGLLVEGILLAANRRIIDVTAGDVTIGLGGLYQGALPFGGSVSATLLAGDIVVDGGTPDEFGGLVELTGSMELISNGDLDLQSNEAETGGGDCKGSGTPPDFNSLDNSRVEVSGNFTIGRCAAWSMTSTEHMALGGNMENQSTAPLAFDWEVGGLQMNGTNTAIEAAGEDRGPWPIGLQDNFAIGTLTLETDAIVQVIDEFDNQQDGLIDCDEVLYVDTLFVSAGAVLLTDGCHVYYNELTNDGTVPGLGTEVLEIREPIAPDLDGDGEVNAFDLASLLGSWGPCPPEDDCPADLDGDGFVGAFDLANLLGVWGPVP